MMSVRARKIADEILFSDAIEVDRADRVPAAHFDALAAAGLYGAAAAEDVDLAAMGAITAALAGGCLSTAFVWIQHSTPLRAIRSHPAFAHLLPAFATGERRGGIGLAGIRPSIDFLRVRREGTDLVLDGTVPWVTGWGMIDTLYVAARDADDRIHFMLMDAVDAPTLVTTAQRLVAVQASNTVNVTFAGHAVPGDRLVEVVPFDEWRATDSFGSAMNGFLAIGLVDRCVRLLRDGPLAAHADGLAAEADATRTALATADPNDVAVARAAASELAWRASGVLATATGARAVLLDQHAQRLAREAVFLLVFGSRPAIRDALAARLDPR